MQNIGFIGLGNMGISMAKNLVKGGFVLTGYDTDPNRLELLQALGGTPAGSCKEVGEHSEAVFIMVLHGSQVKEAIFGEDGLLQGLKPGATIIVLAGATYLLVAVLAALGRKRRAPA